MTIKGDEFRKKAEEAETSAKLSLDFRASEMYCQVAACYRELGEAEDRRDSRSRR